MPERSAKNDGTGYISIGLLCASRIETPTDLLIRTGTVLYRTFAFDGIEIGMSDRLNCLDQWHIHYSNYSSPVSQELVISTSSSKAAARSSSAHSVTDVWTNNTPIGAVDAPMDHCVSYPASDIFSLTDTGQSPQSSSSAQYDTNISDCLASSPAEELGSRAYNFLPSAYHTEQTVQYDYQQPQILPVVTAREIAIFQRFPRCISVSPTAAQTGGGSGRGSAVTGNWLTEHPDVIPDGTLTSYQDDMGRFTATDLVGDRQYSAVDHPLTSRPTHIGEHVLPGYGLPMTYLMYPTDGVPLRTRASRRTHSNSQPAGANDGFICYWDSCGGHILSGTTAGVRAHLNCAHPAASDLHDVRCHWAGCNQELRQGSLPQHIAGLHLRSLQVPCEYPGCNAWLSRRDSMRRHMKKCHPDNSPNSMSSAYI
ncbi:hypothetical protein WOLCODRAFT_145511 [Wolfiporia cocos MD-104 SS10]|uniref:C2H2-type domain-containing protein n=1 Tax=Wolfiporia cocos (strain MD-104) TaxID=742152 RepID=A0A2H3IZD8_WOLCO|nr:hypothetical protein WOLCODRAFT_145511 [Wolfiporia cocos MD-104 SS10]